MFVCASASMIRLGGGKSVESYLAVIAMMVNSFR